MKAQYILYKDAERYIKQYKEAGAVSFTLEFERKTKYRENSMIAMVPHDKNGKIMGICTLAVKY